MNTQGWSPLGWTGWISLQSKGLKRVFSNTTVQKHQFFGAQLSSQSNSHTYMTTGKTIALTRQTFVGKVISLLFNVLSRSVITFLSRSKHVLISWLQSPYAVILVQILYNVSKSYFKYFHSHYVKLLAIFKWLFSSLERTTKRCFCYLHGTEVEQLPQFWVKQWNHREKI